MLCAAIDCSALRLGDRMALAWLAQRRRLASGERFGVIDTHPTLSEQMPLPRYFPLTFEAIGQVGGLPLWDPGNLWLAATNAFAAAPAAGFFEHVPTGVRTRAAILRAAADHRPRVVMHVLDDAPYNKARNRVRAEADSLVSALGSRGCSVVVLNPRRGVMIGDIDEMLAQMLASDAFVGGDTGPSHVYAMLCPSRPQLAIYPDMRRDQRRFAGLQRSLGLAEPWNSLPKRPGLVILWLRPTRRFRLDGRRLRFERTGRFDADEAAALLAESLKQGRP